jgi:putative sigma-54 modulation protein|tara:strand:+ start:225 stop:524 length:300 start_codon:yes stop_codon:yes gene_type:complete
MEIQVQSIHFNADQKLITFIKERLNKLNLFYDQIIGSEVYLRLDKSDVNQNKIVEIKLNIPGKDLFAKKQCKSFEEATDVTIDALRRQLKKHKGKLLVK